ncbi:Jumonji isoform X1 [Paramuricea clavata]|nr:Jumonji isoform X1 [Paramuricea clavata]
MQRPKRRRATRCLEYNNGMLHEEEIALRRALHASLASKAADDEEPKQTKVKQSDKGGSSVDKSLSTPQKRRAKSNAEPAQTNETIRRSKRKSDEIVATSDRKRQKKLLVRIKPGKKKIRNISGPSKDVVDKKVVKSKALNGKKKMTVNENEGKIKRRRRRKKNVDAVQDDGNIKTPESLAKVHVQRKFAQTSPASPRSLLLYQSQLQPMTTRAKTEDFLDFLCLRGSTRMPKPLEMFNNPCAPMSPLTDDEESNKTTPSKMTPANEKNDNEPEAKRSLIMQLAEGHSSSSSNSLVSSPVSTRVQPYPVLPEFTNSHSVLTHIPSPIPYPTAPTPAKQPGFDVYGAVLSTNPATPSLVPSHPRVSAVVMETHMSPEKQGFLPVSQSMWSSKDTVNSSPQKVGETNTKVSKSPKRSPNKRQESCQGQSPGKSLSKSPSKKQEMSPKTSPNKASKNTSPMKSLKSEVKKENSKPSKNSTDEPGSLPGSAVGTNINGQNLNSVPVFTPTKEEFNKKPFEYIESIKAKAEPFGICVVVPPKTWQPEYCLSDEIRFTTKLQRIHCLGKNYPTVEYELAAIIEHLEQQDILLSAMPQISGCEVDLPFMSKVVEEFGGLQQIIDKRKWVKVADRLRIPKTAVDRVTKLEHIYCKYLLSYDMLSQEEKTKLRSDALGESKKKSSQKYITKGRSMSLASFQRNAKNINEYYMRHANDENVEEVFWQMIDEGQRYVVVHAAELDGTAFPTSKMKPFYKSKWNLNVLPKAPRSLARDLPDVEGITSPTVNVQMVLSAETWHTPPHHFYTLEYLHQGESKIWYSVPSCSKDRFLEVVKAELNGEIGHMKERMIHHSSLAKSGVSVYKVVQEAGQFIVKFPGAYHSSLSTGFAVSEFVSFASLSYHSQIKATFQGDLKSEVNHLFSWESLIVSSVKEELRRNSREDTLNILIPELKELRDVETRLKDELATSGIVENSENENSPEKKSRGRRIDSGEIENCNECGRFCFPSAIMYQTDTPLCLHHGLEKLKRKKVNELTVTSHISLSELNELVKEAEEKLQQVRTTPRKVRRRQAGGVSTVNEGNKD